MTTNSTTTIHRRFATAVLLAAAGAVAAAGLGAAAPANATTNGQYAAIAYSPESNVWGYWTQAPTFNGANVGALSECQNHGGNHCLLVTWAKDGCVALAVDPRDQNHYYGDFGPTQISAMTNALTKNGGGHIVQTTC